MSKRYLVIYRSNRFDRLGCDPDTDEYGTYWHHWGFASTLKTAKTYKYSILKLKDEQPSVLRVYDTWADTQEGEHAPCVYEEELENKQRR